MRRKVGTDIVIPVKLVADDGTPITGVVAPTVIVTKNAGPAFPVGLFTWSEPSAASLPGDYWLTIPAEVNDTIGPMIGAVVTPTAEPYDFMVEVEAYIEADTYAAILSTITVEDIEALLAVNDALVMSHGTGSVTYSDQLTGTTGGLLRGHVIRAFSTVDESTDWSRVKARDVTSQDGAWFTLHLDPGEYMLSIERDGVQVATKAITITDGE